MSSILFRNKYGEKFFSKVDAASVSDSVESEKSDEEDDEKKEKKKKRVGFRDRKVGIMVSTSLENVDPGIRESRKPCRIPGFPEIWRANPGKREQKWPGSREIRDREIPGGNPIVVGCHISSREH